VIEAVKPALVALFIGATVKLTGIELFQSCLPKPYSTNDLNAGKASEALACGMLAKVWALRALSTM